MNLRYTQNDQSIEIDLENPNSKVQIEDLIYSNQLMHTLVDMHGLHGTEDIKQVVISIFNSHHWAEDIKKYLQSVIDMIDNILLGDDLSQELFKVRSPQRVLDAKNRL